MTEACAAEIYPRYCFHLSPTVNTWCLLRAAEIYALEQHAGFQGENFFFFRNLPIKWVRITGLVVALHELEGRRLRVFTIDDSSGKCIEAVIAVQQKTRKDELVQNTASWPATKAGQAHKTAGCEAPCTTESPIDIQVGDVVDAKGSLSIYRNARQIKIEKVTVVKSTAQEIALWQKRSRFRQDVLQKPWTLTQRDIRRCRKESEASAPSADRKKKRLKKKAEEGEGAARSASESTTRQVVSASEIPDHPEKSKRSDARARLVEMIRNGSANGKYDALGL